MKRFYILMIALSITLSACAKHPCSNVEVTSPWNVLTLPTDGRAVCSSAADKFQAHYFKSTSELALSVADSLQAAGFTRLNQDSGEGVVNFTFSKDNQSYFVEIYDWDKGAGLIVRK